jgi:hypothetical protein
MNLFDPYLGQTVVIDVGGPILYIGRLERVEEKTIVLADADVHDLHESKTSKELYAIESKKYGIKINRREVRIARSAVVSLSRLDDVVEY